MARPRTPLGDEARQALGYAAFTALYVATGKFGLGLAVVNASASAVWLPTGLALAAVLLAGRRIAPCIALGAFLVNVTTAGTVLTSLAIAAGNTAEALVGAALLERFVGGRRALDRPVTVFAFVALVFVASAMSASVGVGTLLIAHLAPPPTAGMVWLTWWLGDGIGAIIACPLVLLWADDRRPPAGLARWLELAAVAVATAAIGGAVFGGLHGAHGITDPLVFVCLPPVLWAGVRFAQREAAAISLLLMAVALRGSLLGHGPFARLPANESLLLLQAFAAITTVTGLVLAAAIAGQRRLERELSLRARELMRSNQELEEFAYVAAHDLQEPARMIVSYLQLIERRAPELDAATRERFALVVASASRMQGMIRAILDYSRIGKEEASQGEVDLGEVVKQALQDLGEKIRASGAQVEVGALPRVHGSATQLRRLFQNLVSNALKFRSERAPLVRIAAERGEGAWIFAVADNGIGIAAEEGRRLFGLFQRLHAADAYPGHGIGLATCKNVVGAHGGRIWFDSQPGAGTTFRFTLPDRARDP